MRRHLGQVFCTARGKAWSRRNAVRHGLTSRIVLFDPPGTPVDPNVQDLLQNLKQKFAIGQDPSDPILQTVGREYAHQYLATLIEARLAENGFDDSNAPVSLRNLIRYRTTSEPALLKSLAKRSVTKWCAGLRQVRGGWQEGFEPLC